MLVDNLLSCTLSYVILCNNFYEICISVLVMLVVPQFVS